MYNRTFKRHTYELGDKLLRSKTQIYDSTDPYHVFEPNYDDYFYYSHDGVIAERHDDTSNMAIFTRWGRELLTVGSSIYIQNIRGDVVMIVGADGNVKTIRDYDVSGEMLSHTPREDRDPFGFIGGLDTGNGLWKLGARFYDSGKGSFIQQDRYLGDPGDPLSLNRYVYCKLDPVNLIDPTGFDSEEVGLKEPPPDSSGYVPPKGGPRKVKGPNGKPGWLDKDGNVWQPDPSQHGGPHWDVQNPKGGYDNVYNNGKVRKGSGPRGTMSPTSKGFSTGLSTELGLGAICTAVGIATVAILLIPETGGASLLALAAI